MFLQSLMRFHLLFFKILRKQNVTDTLSFVCSLTNELTDNVKTVYPPTNTVCGGYNYIVVICIIDVGKSYFMALEAWPGSGLDGCWWARPSNGLDGFWCLRAGTDLLI